MEFSWGFAKRKGLFASFKLSRVGNVINIEHTQYVPEYKSFIKVNAKDLEFKEEMKIYVIDSEVYSTMLLSKEY